MSPARTLPVESLERIFHFAFTLDRLSNPSSPPRTPAGTFSLLLVSKGFHELVLPFFYRSITIYRSSDWSALFSPTNGVLVVGEAAARRRGWVRELNIKADVPVDFEAFEQLIREGGDPFGFEHYFVPIAQVKLINLRHVCLLELDEDEERERWRLVKDRIVKMKMIQDGYPESEEDSEDTWDTLEADVDKSVEDRKAAIFQRILGASPIASVDLSLSRYRLHETIWKSAYRLATVIVHFDDRAFRDLVKLKHMVGRAGDPKFDWTKDEQYISRIQQALSQKVRQMKSFIWCRHWTFEAGVVVVGIPGGMVDKIVRVALPKHSVDDFGATAAVMKKKWVWMDEMDDEMIQKEIARGRRTVLHLPLAGTD